MTLNDVPLYLAAAAHFGILTASALTPRALKWNEHLKELPRLMRQLFWVYGVFIVFIIISFGTLTLIHREAILAGDTIAKSLCGLIALFWGLRLLVQLAIFDAKPFLTNLWYKIGYHTLTVTFVFLTTYYAIMAWHPTL